MRSSYGVSQESLLSVMAMTFLPDPAMPARGRVAVYRPSEGGDPDDWAALAATARHAGLGEPKPEWARIARLVGARPHLVDARVAAVALDTALPALLAQPRNGAPDGASQLVWRLAARLAVALVAGHRMVPDLTRAPSGVLHGVWRASVDDAQAGLARLAAAMPPAGHAVARTEHAVWDPAALLSAFLDAVADHAARSAGAPGRPGRPRERVLPWTARWVEALADADDPRVPLRGDAEDILAGVAGWRADDTDAEEAAVQLQLRAPETQDGDWTLELGVRRPDGTLLPAAAVWAGDADDAAGWPPALQTSLLRGLGRCARMFPPLDEALRQAAPEQVTLNIEQAWTFLADAADRLADTGVVVLLPDDLARDDLALRLRVDAPERQDDAGDTDVLEDRTAVFEWELALGDERVEPEELDELLAAGAPLVRWRERWVRVEPARVARLRDEQRGRGELPLVEALALGLAGTTSRDDAAGDAADDAPVVVSGGVAGLLDRLRAASERPPTGAAPPGFSGALRGYQQRGVAWLDGMAALGLGAVLADEMGLGKTPQLIAHLLARGERTDGDTPRPSLIVCPTSVVGNWERELARFAPGIEVTRHHGPDRARRLTGCAGAVLTTYGILRRDVDLLAGVDWDVVALDEAQHIKNPATAGARAARRLRSRQTVALTGTPLENRLAELWAIMDVTNPGLLGSRARFGRRFAVPVERHGDAEATRRLRRLVAPFVLRREKRDPAVVADLPPKIERTIACSLTLEQARLYRAAVDRALGSDAVGDGGRARHLAAGSAIARRGRILALLTALKQVCNHPAQYLDEPADAAQLLGRSGKLAAAREIVHEVASAGEQILVFTQYVAMGRLLVAQLSADLGRPVPFLHGAVPAPARDRMVAAFQGEAQPTATGWPAGDRAGGDGPAPVLVVSLRAGGTGLNLTAATHVLHYDRWWNPAVEDQATDRAHRIGQRRTVEVHKLVTAGTVEERVAELLERKRGLAATVIDAGESWVTELTDAELRELVALTDDASVADLDDEDVEYDHAGWGGDEGRRPLEEAG